MNCPEFEKSIALFVEGDLPETKTADVRNHLEHCEGCREFAEELKASQAMLKGLADVPVEDEWLRAARNQVLLQTSREPRHVPQWRWALGAGLVTAVVLATILIWPAKQRRVPLPPQETPMQAKIEAAPPAPVVPHRVEAQPNEAPQAPIRKSHLVRKVRATSEPTKQPVEMTVKLLTDDPNIVIYWIVN